MNHACCRQEGNCFYSLLCLLCGAEDGAMNVSDIGGLLLRQVAGKMDKYGEYAG